MDTIQEQVKRDTYGAGEGSRGAGSRGAGIRGVYVLLTHICINDQFNTGV